MGTCQPAGYLYMRRTTLSTHVYLAHVTCTSMHFHLCCIGLVQPLVIRQRAGTGWNFETQQMCHSAAIRNMALHPPA